MYSSVLLLLLASSTTSLLTCNRQGPVCPGTVVTCVCEAAGALIWRVPSDDCAASFILGSMVGDMDLLCDSHSVVLDAVNTGGDLPVYVSSLTLTLVEDLSVTCESGFDSASRGNVTLRVASKLDQ